MGVHRFIAIFSVRPHVEGRENPEKHRRSPFEVPIAFYRRGGFRTLLTAL